MDLEETRAFLAVLEHGSFKAAADNLGQPRATLRRRVESLEVRAGAPLLVRSRNGVEATAAGQVLASHARGLLRETDALLSALREVADETPRGLLRVAVSTELAAPEVARLLGPLRGRFPDLRLALRRVAEPLAEPLDAVDLALAVSEAGGPSRWAVTALRSFAEGLGASAAYLAARGIPTTIAALAEHELLALAGPRSEHGELDEGEHRWPLRHGGSVPVRASVTCGEVEQLRELALAGHGIALLADPAAAGLVPVLDDAIGRRGTLAVAVPEALAQTPKLRSLVAALTAQQPALHALSRRAEGAEGAGSARLAG